MPRPAVTATLVDGDIAKLTLPAFSDEFADEVLTTIAEFRAQSELRGVVLDLRGNGGGSPDALRTLLGALAHNKVYNHWCDVKGRCTPNRTDDSVELLGLPFIALTDRRCVSACDAFAAAVKELRLGTLVGARTAGAVSGPAYPFVLEDGSSVAMPKFHQVGAHKGIVDTIGVAPDHIVPLTAADLSTGRDPVLAKAVSLL
jgi:carboxyl-terminal processing protease